MRKNIALSVLLIALLVSVFIHVLGTPPETSNPTPQIDTSSTNQPKAFTIIFVTHDYGAGVFRKMEQGMKDACELVGAEGMFVGPAEYAPEEQVVLLDAAIAQNPDFLVTTRAEGNGVYDEVIRKALDQGITVMTFNVNAPGANMTIPLPHYGQDFKNFGKVWAEEVMKDLPDGGKIAVLHTGVGNFALDERMESFLLALQEEGKGKWLVKDILDQKTTDEAKLMGIISAYHASNQDIKGFYGVDYYAHLLATYVEQNDLQGRLKVGGSDMGPGFVNGLKNGDTSFALTQNAYLQGFYPVIAAYLKEVKNIDPVGMDTGTQVIYPSSQKVE